MKKIMLGAAALVLSAAASAEGYVGGVIGASNVEMSCGFPYNSCDSSDTGFKFYGGFVLPNHVVPHLSLEASYIDFGKARGSRNVLSTTLYTRSLEVSALTFGAALRYNFTPALSGVGRLGLAYVDAKSTGDIESSHSSSTLKLHAGLGLEYAFTKQFKVLGSADFTNYDTGSESGSARLIGLGAQYGF
jgi:OOP family OmpA-OmpF porin